MPKLIAVWNTQMKLWIKPEESLFSEHLEPFLETWPTSGTMRNGQAFELPTQALHIKDLESSLLPTPILRDHKDGRAEVIRNGKVQVDTVGRAIINSGEVNLPTPTRSDYKGPNHSKRRTTSAKGLPARAIDSTDWGKYEPAIRRWEAISGRAAPLPTKPDGKDGNIRLSSSFSEWMMGLPEDWVCSQGLSRNDELKLIGNGVVPQQAQLALSILLRDTEFLKENNETM